MSSMKSPLSELRSALRKAVPGWLISTIKEQVGAPDMKVSLGRLKTKGFSPSAVVDIGAYQGWWSELARSVFPQAEILMVEPLPDRAEQLSSLAGRIQARYCQALCGAHDEQLKSFFLGSIGSSIYVLKRF